MPKLQKISRQRRSGHNPARQVISRFHLFPVAGVLLILLPAAAHADLILSLTPAGLSGNPGDTITFKGQITNTTGVTLNATDMFLNFGAYDGSTLLDVSQLLGTPDFVLLNNHISTAQNLFDLGIAPTAGPGTYTIDVSVQDINNNASAVVTASVTVGGVSGVPEPNSLALIATMCALCFGIAATKKHPLRAGRRLPPGLPSDRASLGQEN